MLRRGQQPLGVGLAIAKARRPRTFVVGSSKSTSSKTTATISSKGGTPLPLSSVDSLLRDRGLFGEDPPRIQDLHIGEDPKGYPRPPPGEDYLCTTVVDYGPSISICIVDLAHV